MTAGLVLRRAELSDMEAVARLHRRVRAECLPYLPDLHTPQEDLTFFQEQVFPKGIVWLAGEKGLLIGYAATSEGWLDHLYVEPSRHGRDIGSALLAKAKERVASLELWTFQKNDRARRFYERHGFECIELTDGAGNEEKEPDARYRWRA
ncbi:GNAT family N-acetyltransferase [Microvirga sp. 2TAF3]|uniref:GNAT family N-acetyltransferase n=1 Tax=Microvirga sp. 2TAF3 TaxID=3233014 RepID=UPI003F98D819